MIAWRGLIFDLDGTLTLPGLIDFPAMRAAIGCPLGRPILEFIAQLSQTDPQAGARAMEEVDRREREAALKTEPAPGLETFLAFLRTLDVPRAIFTRNSRTAAQETLARLDLVKDFSQLVAREDGPPKPHPQGVWQLCRGWGLEPRQVLMVGDYLHDLEAGAAAGASTALVTWRRPPSFDLERFRLSTAGRHPTHLCDDLQALQAILSSTGM